MGRIKKLVGSAQTKRKADDDKKRKTIDVVKNRLYLGFLYALSLVSTALLVRLCVKMVRLAIVAVSRNDEL